MKKIIIFGASGRVGLKLIEYTLNLHYKVTAFVRDPNKIKISHTNLEIISGDVLNKEKVENAIKGQDIVLSALSGRTTKPDYSVLTTGIENVISAMKKFDVRRILNVAGAGILEDLEYGLRRNRPGYPEIFRNVSAENWKVYELFQKEKINWTMVCAPEMPDGKRTGIYRMLIDFLPMNGSKISTEDVADFIVKNIETVAIYNKRIGISY